MITWLTASGFRSRIPLFTPKDFKNLTHFLASCHLILLSLVEENFGFATATGSIKNFMHIHRYDKVCTLFREITYQVINTSKWLNLTAQHAFSGF